MEYMINITAFIFCSLLSGYIIHILYLYRIKNKEGGVARGVNRDIYNGSAEYSEIQNEILFSLISKGELFTQDLQTAVRAITEAGAMILNCGRVSVWFYNDDYSLIRCADLYTLAKGEHSSGAELASPEFPSYKQAHLENLVIAAADVLIDPRTKELPASYYLDNGITSMVDAPLWNNNRLCGVLSFEHTGMMRVWTKDDERISMIMAVIVSLCIETDMRYKAEKDLHDAEMQLRRTGDNLSGGMIYQLIVKPDGSRAFTYVSAGVKQLHGYTPEQVVADSTLLYRQIVSGDIETLLKEEERSFREFSPFDVEVKFMLETGEIRWSRIFSHPRLLNNGDIASDGLEIDITESKKNEIALVESEKRYRILYERMMDAFVVVAMDGRILEFNDAYLQLTGYARDEIKNLSYSDITPVKWHSFENEIITEQVMTRGYSDVYEKEYIRKDGTIVPIELRAYYIKGNINSEDRIWGIIRDISERKKNEALLAYREENLRITLDSIGDAVISTDTEGRIVRMNPAALRLTGWTMEEAAGRNFTDVFIVTNFDRSGGFLNPVENVLRKGEIVFLEEDTLLLSRNGREYRITDSAAPILNESGETAGVVLVFRDVTEQYILEQESIQNALSFRTIFEASPYSIVIQSASDGRYIMVNPAFERNTGYRAEEIIGKTLMNTSMGSTEDYSRFTEQLKETGRLDNMSVKSINKAGEEHYLLFSSRVIEFNGEACVLTMTMDITEMRHMQEQLNHAQKMDAIGQLAGGVAHDFNNMLGGILGAAELLQINYGDDAKRNKYIQMIRTTAERAASLTGKLLAFSRAGDYEEVPVDLHKVIEEAAEILYRTIDKKITIKLHLNAESHTVTGDTSQLMNVFLNLGINAGHAMPEGGVLDFSTRVVELDEHYCRVNSPVLQPGRFIVIEVQDTGCGILPEHINKVFEPFFTTREKGKGTGMGLASVYGSVGQHHGTISVYSEPGRGTVFHLYLPLVKSNSSEQITYSESLPGTGRILVVDDEEIMRITARDMLQYLGYEVILAENGKEGAAIFAREKGSIDIVLLDMVMPVMNGRECFRELKRIDPDVKVIISSGFIHDENINEMRSEGLAGFIRKPYQTSDLSRMLARVMSS